MPITALYAAILAPLFVLLSVRVIRMRQGAGAALGDNGDPVLLRRMRVQANFAEYVPLALILLAGAESMRTDNWVLHILGISLVIGRVSHAFGVSQSNERYRFRIAGMALTLTMMVMAAGVCLFEAVLSARSVMF